MSLHNPIILEYKIKNNQNPVKELYLDSISAQDAEKRIKALYGQSLLWSKLLSGTEAEMMYKKIYGEKNNVSSSNEGSGAFFGVFMFVLVFILLYIAK